MYFLVLPDDPERTAYGPFNAPDQALQWAISNLSYPPNVRLYGSAALAETGRDVTSACTFKRLDGHATRANDV